MQHIFDLRVIKDPLGSQCPKTFFPLRELELQHAPWNPPKTLVSPLSSPLYMADSEWSMGRVTVKVVCILVPRPLLDSSTYLCESMYSSSEEPAYNAGKKSFQTN
jgi:hypothetical protein